MKTFPYCANFFECLFLVLSNSAVKNRSINFECFLRRFVIGFKSFRIINAGMRFPSVPIIKAWIGERPRLIPSGMPRRSSSPGSIEVKKVVISGVVKFSSMLGL